MKLILQGSLEYNGISYIPGDEVDVPESIYDMLVDSYIRHRDIIESAPIEDTNQTVFELLNK